MVSKKKLEERLKAFLSTSKKSVQMMTKGLNKLAVKIRGLTVSFRITYVSNEQY